MFECAPEVATPIMPARVRASPSNESDTEIAYRDSLLGSSMRRAFSENEMDPRRFRREPRSKDRLKRSSGKAAPTSKKWKHALLVALFMCGPVGTIVSFWLLPKVQMHGDPNAWPVAPSGPRALVNGGKARMVHLSLVGTSRRARFVLDDQTLWESFMAGCKDRLQACFPG